MRILPLPLLASLIPVISLSVAPAALLVQEPFDHSAGTMLPDYSAGEPEVALQPASVAGTGLTLQRRPSKDREPVTIGNGLSYQDSRGRTLRTSGQSAVVPQGGSTVFNLYETGPDDPFAKLRNPDEPRELGKAGEVVWMSFLVMVGATPSPEDLFSLRFSGTKTSFPIGLNLRRSSGEPTLGAISSAGKTPIDPEKVHLIVLRFVLGEAGGAEMWVDPDLGGERPSEEPNPSIQNIPIFIRSLWFTKNSDGELPVTFDELRIGESYADVAPIK